MIYKNTLQVILGKLKLEINDLKFRILIFRFCTPFNR